MTKSIAHVSTERPGRYGKQLASHFSAKIEAWWDADSATGHCVFDREGARGTLDLAVEPGALVLDIDAAEEDLDGLENVVARHLVGFGKKDGLKVAFVREDGSAGLSFAPEDLPAKRG
ncbi:MULTISPECIES: DUF2218 domain-containing protein [Corynebacterium]|uniref:DUF2218 domain-containing protein n=1 Tax=Corynebacterium TaxID=1716 RepID=UPI00257FB4A9|nr:MULTISPECIES: DUF2218 domain-containing protein [Corynebacterium]